jgi:hypothetical protein
VGLSNGATSSPQKNPPQLSTTTDGLVRCCSPSSKHPPQLSAMTASEEWLMLSEVGGRSMYAADEKRRSSESLARRTAG